MPFVYTRPEERSQFFAELKRRNISSDAFTVSDAPRQIVPAGATEGPTVSQIKVESCASGIAQTYQVSTSLTYAPPADDRVQWVRDFAADLDSGKFGQIAQ